MITTADQKLLAKWLLDIYNLGDRDECSWKHLGHGMAALLAFDTWKATLDYTRPTDRTLTRPEEVKLGALWDCVRKIVVRVGKQSILDVLPDLSKRYTEFLYLNTYVNADWLTYKQPILNQHLFVNED